MQDKLGADKNLPYLHREFWHGFRDVRIGNETNVHRRYSLQRLRLSRPHIGLPCVSGMRYRHMREAPQLPSGNGQAIRMDRVYQRRSEETHMRLTGKGALVS